MNALSTAMDRDTDTLTGPARAQIAGHHEKTILLVDDDSSVREMIGRVLSREGYLVVPASSGIEAVGISHSRRVDLVLLDLNMPGLGGWETFARLLALDPLLAVVVITARPNQLFTALGVGVGALLEKPLDFPTLLKTIAALMAESSELRRRRANGGHGDFHYQPAASSRTV